jgi:hypothetical protein
LQVVADNMRAALPPAPPVLHAGVGGDGGGAALSPFPASAGTGPVADGTRDSDDSANSSGECWLASPSS